MKEFNLLRDADGKLYVCGTDAAAVEWEKTKGREPIGKIKTDLDILEVKRYIQGDE